MQHWTDWVKLISGLLAVEKMNRSYYGVENGKFYEYLLLVFLITQDLCPSWW